MVPLPPLVILLYFLVLTAEWTGPVVPPPSLDTAVFSRVDSGVEGIVLRGLVLLCPLPTS